MYPVLLDLGPVTIYAFGTFIVLAFLVSSWFARRHAIRTLQVDGERVFNLCFALLFVGLLGARFVYGMIHYEAMSETPMKIFKIWEGGLSFYGGLAACLLACAWYLPSRPELGGWRLMDVLCLAGCLAIAIGSLASFFSGEHYGDPAPDLAWAVTFPPGQELSQVPRTLRGIPLHPTQLYMAFHGLLLFGILRMVWKRSARPGRAFGLFLMLFAVGRAVIEIWRADDASRGMVIEDHLSLAQVLSLPTFFLGLAIFLTRRTRTAPSETPAEA